jgi:hypothetical protein
MTTTPAIPIIRGETQNIPLTVRNPNGTGLDLSGKTIRFVLVDGTSELLKISGSGVTLDLATAGRFLINITLTEANAYAAGAKPTGYLSIRNADGTLAARGSLAFEVSR